MVRRPSVRLSVRPCLIVVWFAAERPVGRTYRSTAAGAQQQQRRSTALSSKCGQCHVGSRVDEAEHRLFYICLTFVVCFSVFYGLRPDSNNK